MEFNEEQFTIDSDIKCEWAIKKIKEATAEADRLKAIIVAEREELDRKETEIDEKLKHETSYLKGLLFEYFGKVVHKKTKTQESYKLLSGSLIYKLPTTKIAKPDDDELVKYLETNAPIYVETVKKAAWGEYKKSLSIAEDGSVVDTATGEVVDFIKTEESEGSFDIKVEK